MEDRTKARPLGHNNSMEVHIFRATGRVFGCTEDEAGGNLPAELGPWQYFKTIDLIKGGPDTPGIDGDECISDIESYGFHITDAHVRVTENFIPSPSELG